MSCQFPVLAGKCPECGEADFHAPAGETAQQKIRDKFGKNIFAGIVHSKGSFRKLGDLVDSCGVGNGLPVNSLAGKDT